MGQGSFAFVEFNDPRDADDACRVRLRFLAMSHVLTIPQDLHGRNFMGDRLIVEPAKRPPGPPTRGPRGPPPSVRRGRFRLYVGNLPPGTSWQDLKDIGRKYGGVSFADVDPYRRDEGIIEFESPADLEAALRIDGMEMRGSVLRADPEDPSFLPPPPRRSPSPRRSRSPLPLRDERDERDYPPPRGRRDDYQSPPRDYPSRDYRDEYRSPPGDYRSPPREMRSPRDASPPRGADDADDERVVSPPRGEHSPGPSAPTEEAVYSAPAPVDEATHSPGPHTPEDQA